MTRNPDYEGTAPQKHDKTVPLPENIIIVSDISIIAGSIDAIADIENRSFDPPWKKSDFLDELRSSDALMLLLFKSGLPKGYLCSRNILDETHINKMCIHPDVRGCGYGKLLLNKFIGSYAGKIYLEVARSNITAIRLYDGAGFRINRVRKGIYENGDDAFEMILDQ